MGQIWERVKGEGKKGPGSGELAFPEARTEIASEGVQGREEKTSEG